MPNALVIAGVDIAFIAFLFFLRGRERTPQFRMPIGLCLLLSALFVLFSFPAAPMVDRAIKDVASNLFKSDNIEQSHGAMGNKLK